MRELAAHSGRPVPSWRCGVYRLSSVLQGSLTMQLILQTMANALSLSLTYVLVSMGLTLMFSVMQLINFAHGELFMLGGFGIYVFFHKWGINYIAAFAISVVLVSVVGFIIYRIIFRPLRHDFLAAVLASLGIGMIIQNGTQFLFGQDDVGVRPVVSGVVDIANVRVAVDSLVVASSAAFFAIALIVFMKYAKAGKAIRSVAEDREAASLQGVDVKAMDAMGFIIASALAAAAGALMAPLFFLNPFVGLSPMLKGFIIILLGGMGSISGAMLGSFVLGFIETFGLTYVGLWANIVGFLIVMLLILVRPSGFFGRQVTLH